MSWLFIPACILVLFQSVLTNRIIDRLDDFDSHYYGDSVLLEGDSLWMECTLTYLAGYVWFIISIIYSYFSGYSCHSCGEIHELSPWIAFSVQLLMFINTYNYGKPLGYLLTGLFIIVRYLIQAPAFFVDDLIQGKLKKQRL